MESPLKRSVIYGFVVGLSLGSRSFLFLPQRLIIVSTWIIVVIVWVGLRTDSSIVIILWLSRYLSSDVERCLVALLRK